MTRTGTMLRTLLATVALAALAACSTPLLSHDAAGTSPADNSPGAQAAHGQAQTGQFQ